MEKRQSLLCLLVGLALCVTIFPETESWNVTERSFTDRTEKPTQIPERDVNVTSHYDIITEGFPTVETENSTYTVLIAEPEGFPDLGTLIGMVAGVVSLIGVSAMVIILIVRKMGRYSKLPVMAHYTEKPIMCKEE